MLQNEEMGALGHHFAADNLFHYPATLRGGGAG